MQSVFSWAPRAPKVARKCGSKHWFAYGADGRSLGRSVYGHVITKFSRMGSLPLFLTHGNRGNPRMLTAREIYFHKFVHKKVFLRGLYNKLHKDCSRGKQLNLFPSNLNVSQGRFSGNRINCFSRDQVLSVYYIMYLLNHFLVLALNNWRLLLPSSGNLYCETITLVRIGLRLNKSI